MRFKEYLYENEDKTKLKVENFFVTPKCNDRGYFDHLIKKDTWYAKFYIDHSVTTTEMFNALSNELGDLNHVRVKCGVPELLEFVNSLQDLEYYLMGYVFLMSYQTDQVVDQLELTLKLKGTSVIPILFKNSKYYIVNQDCKLKQMRDNEIINLEEFMKGINN